MTLEQRVLDFIRKYSLVESRTIILVAVSGGPDSVCLLHVLSGLRRELGIELHAAHLNHGLRSGESDADAEYVADLCLRLNVPLTIESREVKEYRAQNRTSLEEAAREVRYAFLAETTDKVGAACVAAGHTSDDHAETILMHLLRGSGTRGLRGLQPFSRWQSSGSPLVIIRPLLEISRQETDDYCRRHELNPRQDSSNLSMEPSRNRVRHHLLPLLAEYNPRIKDALLRTARIAVDDLSFIEGEAARALATVTRQEGDSIVINKASFTGLHPALKRHLLRSCIENLIGSLKDIEAGHIEDIVDALDKPAGKTIGLPGGLNFTIEYDRYVLGHDPAALSPFPDLQARVKLNIPGNTAIPGWNIQADILAGSGIKNHGEADDDFTARFDYSTVGTELFVRSRRPGDRLQPLGMEHPKKLNEYMIDARIPRAWRRRVPLVTSPEHIIWVVGWRIDERAKVTAGSRQVLRLRFNLS